MRAHVKNMVGWLAPLGAKALVFVRLVHTQLLSVHQYVAHVCGSILLYRGHKYRLTSSQTSPSVTGHLIEYKVVGTATENDA